MIIADRSGRMLEFRNASELLRWLSQNTSQYGQRQSVERYYLGSPDKHGDYWLWESTRVRLSKEDYARVYAVQKRYRAYCQHMREVDPEWFDVETIPYMDNSVEVIQESRKYPGVTRRVTTVRPHGDAC